MRILIQKYTIQNRKEFNYLLLFLEGSKIRINIKRYECKIFLLWWRCLTQVTFHILSLLYLEFVLSYFRNCSKFDYIFISLLRFTCILYTFLWNKLMNSILKDCILYINESRELDVNFKKLKTKFYSILYFIFL